MKLHCCEIIGNKMLFWHENAFFCNIMFVCSKHKTLKPEQPASVFFFCWTHLKFLLQRRDSGRETSSWLTNEQDGTKVYHDILFTIRTCEMLQINQHLFIQSVGSTGQHLNSNRGPKCTSCFSGYAQ